MKLLIIGCNGMVGHVVSMYLFEHGHDVTGYDSEKSAFVKTIQGSFFDTQLLDGTIRNGVYDAAINCTAIINQFAEEDKVGAVFVNSFLPHFLEKITAGTKTVVVHRSTDCIFSGKRGGYGLDDIPDADSFYAKTKALGELINEKDITIRTSLVGPEQESEGIGLLNWFMSQLGEVKGYSNAIWTGLTTIEFAREIDYLLQHKAHGLFQCVPDKAISKYELLKLFSDAFPGDRRLIRIDNKRVDKSLVQIVGDYGIEVPVYETMMNEMAEWVHIHKELYPHYSV